MSVWEKEETCHLFRSIYLGYSHLFSCFLIVFWFFSDQHPVAGPEKSGILTVVFSSVENIMKFTET